MKIKNLTLILLFSIIGLIASTNQKTETSSVTFKINNFGSAVNVSFSKFDFKIDYKKDKPSTSTFAGDIFISSIKTGIDMRDKHLKEEDYFNEKKFPKISFSSTDVKVKNDSILTVNGNLKMKDVTKKISLDVKIKTLGTKTIFTTTAKLNRRNFNVGGKSISLSDDVFISIKSVK